MTEPLREEKLLKPQNTPILYIDQRWRPVNTSQIVDSIHSVSEQVGIMNFLPAKLLEDAREKVPSTKKEPVEITAEEFVLQMKTLGEKYVHPNIPQYFGEQTRLCMNLTALMTNYLSEVYGFPVVGLYDPSDEKHKNYIRPVSAIFDRVPQYAQFAHPERYSLEDMVEVKLGDKIFAVDFNFWYGDKRNKGMLVEEITTREMRVKLGQEYGLWTTEFAGFNNTDKQEVISYVLPKDRDKGAADYYLNTDMSPYFLMIVGEESLTEYFNKNVAPYFDSSDPYEFDERWQNMFISFRSTGVKVRDYIKKVSIGSLVSQGHTPQELSGSGRNYFVPTSIEQRKLLTHLPKPEEAPNLLSS